MLEITISNNKKNYDWFYFISLGLNLSLCLKHNLNRFRNNHMLGIIYLILVYRVNNLKY